jgi:GNAT superfamily N-acetyltransferase
MFEPANERVIASAVEIVTHNDGELEERIILSIREVGYADLSYDLDAPDTLTLNDVFVEKDKRTDKAGSLLFEEVIKLAKDKGFTYIEGEVANERVARGIIHRFREDQVLIGPVTPDVAEIYAEPGENYLTLSALEQFFHDARKVEQSGEGSSMLHTSVMVQVTL